MPDSSDVGWWIPGLTYVHYYPNLSNHERKKYIKWNLKQLKMVSLTIERLFAEKNRVRWSKVPFSAWATSSPIGNMTIKRRHISWMLEDEPVQDRISVIYRESKHSSPRSTRALQYKMIPADKVRPTASEFQD